MTMLPVAPDATRGGILEQEEDRTVSDITMPNVAEVDDPEDPMEDTTDLQPAGLGRLGPNSPQLDSSITASSPTGEGIPTVENQPAKDPLSTHFQWTVENFSKISTKKKFSEIFAIDSYKWRLLIFPKGNGAESLSIYLDVPDPGDQPIGWSREADFTLSVVNQIDASLTANKDTKHKFNGKESDWGFTTFMSLEDLYDHSKGFVVNDTLVIEAKVAIKQDFWAWDSKKATGYVGLKNQGATCYMNSLLQTLYHIPYFCKAVYHMPTTENDVAVSSIALALQSLFYKLQYSDTSVSTKDLTKSFGWDAVDSFMQHDVQELNRVLCEKLEEKMKGTTVEGTIQHLFEGHHMNYIDCINVDYKSNRKESFYDLQLDVKGCSDVYASFDKYTEVEELVGDNKYAAEQHGLQDARKGVSFLDFPPVLQLQLKRFEYDFMRDTMVKINDRYAFPLHLDLDREGGKYLAPDKESGVENKYTLHSVLVHSGGVHGGHYYAYISPTLDHKWFKFDDERVTVEEARGAMDEQYGGDEETRVGLNPTPFKFTNYSNAYMLVYIRDADRSKIMCQVDATDIAEHLQVQLKREQEEKERKKKEKAEAHLYTVIKVATDDDLREQIGRTLFFDLVDHDRVKSFRVPKQTLFGEFREEAGRDLHVPLSSQRFWNMARRKNHTYRPSHPLTPAQEAMQVAQLREGAKQQVNAELKLYLETGPTLEGPQPGPPQDRVKDDVLVFFKVYDPDKEQLNYAGNLFVNLTTKPMDIVARLNALVGYPSVTDLLLFEEVRSDPVMCDPVEADKTFRSLSVEDGDIICFQKKPTVGVGAGVRFPLVDAFLSYVRHRQVVHFRRLDKPKEEEVAIELSLQNTYDEVMEQLAKKVGVEDPRKLRLTQHNCYSCMPRPPAIKYRGVDHLQDMLVHYNQTADILYFEVLDLPLPELQGLKTLKVAFHNLKAEEVGVHSVRLPKLSSVGDVLDHLRQVEGVGLSKPEAELRMLEIFDHKIYKLFPPTEPIDGINDQYWSLRAEEVPEDQRGPLQSPQERLIHVYHFFKDANGGVHNFGDPFLFRLHESETVGEVRGRIQKQLGVADAEWGGWGTSFVSLGRPESLKDEEVVAGRFNKRDTYGAWEHYLGLEHTDSAPRRHHQNQNRHGYGYEKAVKIYN